MYALYIHQGHESGKCRIKSREMSYMLEVYKNFSRLSFTQRYDTPEYERPISSYL
jgi:hypothetical protein